MKKILNLMKHMCSEMTEGQQKLGSEVKGEVESLRQDVKRQLNVSKSQVKVVASKLHWNTVRVEKWRSSR